MRIQPVNDLHKLADELERRFKDTSCVVNLRHGQDELAQARLEVEQIYVDDRVPTTRTLRVVGRTPGGRDHGAVAIPLGPEMSGQWTDADGRVDIVQGAYILSIIPSAGRRQRELEERELARV